MTEIAIKTDCICTETHGVCSDLISRQAAIDAINNAVTKECAIWSVKELPSADRPKGEWLQKDNIYGVSYCSECDYELHTNDADFCPNCGADMRGDTE